MIRLLIAHLLFLVSAIWLLGHVKWFVDNPDSFQYLHLAERYADGSFENVINGYWSPLIIWALIVPVKLFYNGIIAFKVLQILIGSATLHAWHKLLRVTNVGDAYGLLLFAAIPLLLARSLLTLTSDLLFITIAMLVLTMAIKGVVFRSTRSAILFGLCGGLLYFAKAFGAPLFVAFLFLLFLLERFDRNLPAALITRNAFLSMGAFLVIILPWVVALSSTYGHFTISEAARYNQTVEVAPMPEEFVFLPVLTDGLYDPPPAAISPWEAPGDLVDLTPLRPWTDPHRYARLIKRNLMSIYYYDVRRQIGSVLLLLLGLVMIIRRPRSITGDRAILLPLLFMLTLTFGYSFILVNTRYIWLNTFLMMLICAKLFQLLLPHRILLRNAMLAALLLLALKRPTKEILLKEDINISAGALFDALASPVATLRSTYDPDHVLMAAIEKVRPLQLNGRMASLQSEDPLRGSYSSTLQIVYELGLKYYGLIPMDRSREAQLRALQKFDIDYFVVWDDMEWDHGDLILDMDPPGPRIYELK